MMKRILFLGFAVLLCASQYVVAGGAVDLTRGKGSTWTKSDGTQDTAGKCDEQYFAVIKLKIDRPEAIPFTINAQGGKVEFSSGNLQWQPATDTYRFAREQWHTIGYAWGSVPAYSSKLAQAGTDSRVTAIANGVRYTDPVTGGVKEIVRPAVTRAQDSSLVYWDSIVVTYLKKWRDDADHSLGYTTDTIYDTIPVLCNNLIFSKTYKGWRDRFGWGTSGYDRAKIINSVNKPNGEMLLDTFVSLIQTTYNNVATVNTTYNYYGIGPSYGMKQGTDTIPRHIDTTMGTSRNYDWGYYNNIYCVWKGYDTCRVTDATVGSVMGADSIVWDSTMFNKGTWRILTSAEWAYMLTKNRNVKLSNGYVDTSLSPAILHYSSTEPNKVIHGALIYPDNFNLSTDCPGYSGQLYSGRSYLTGTNFKVSDVSYADWVLLEKQGVIFIPAYYYSRGGTFTCTSWTATAASAQKAYEAFWMSGNSNTSFALSANNAPGGTGGMGGTQSARSAWLMVRLVRDLDVETLESAYKHRDPSNDIR